jgi:hypothetical protein
MRVRPHYVRQSRKNTPPATVIMPVPVGVISIVVAVRPARTVHAIQHARQSALQHIDRYQA